jgi:hypothetical protein
VVQKEIQQAQKVLDTVTPALGLVSLGGTSGKQRQLRKIRLQNPEAIMAEASSRSFKHSSVSLRQEKNWRTFPPSWYQATS